MKSVLKTALSMWLLVLGCPLHAAAPTNQDFYDPLEGNVDNPLLGPANKGTYIGSTPEDVTTGGAPLSIRIPVDKISAQEGTIMFWVRPRYGLHDAPSHTLLHANLQPSSHYMTLSDGWWEPGGAHRLYFIFRSLKDGVITASHAYPSDIARLIDKRSEEPATPFVGNKWKFIALTWRRDPVGHLRIYVNGQFPPGHGSMNVSNVGSLYDFATQTIDGQSYAIVDLGNSPGLTRDADAEFDEFSVYKRALSDVEIDGIYRAYLQDGYLLGDWSYHRNEEWMEPERSQAYTPMRDRRGRIVENRAIFDETAMFLSPAFGPAEVIDWLKSANMNVYIPAIWHGRGARWKIDESVYPPTGENADPEVYDTNIWCGDPAVCARFSAEPAYTGTGNADPFAELIARAHAEGIEVHPWFTVFLAQWSDPNKHSAWRDQNDPYVTDPGKRMYDPENLQFRAYMKKRILDVVARYDIDGVNLDFIRYHWPTTDNDLKARHGAAVEEFVREVSTAIRLAKPELVISIDGAVRSEFDSHSLQRVNDVQGRNQMLWMEKGLIDVAFDMDYSERFNVHLSDRAREYIVEKGGSKHGVVKLVGNYFSNPNVTIPCPREPQLLTDLVRTSQNRWPRSVAIYWLEELMKDARQLECNGVAGSQIGALTAQSGPFAEPARTLWVFNKPKVTIDTLQDLTDIRGDQLVSFDGDAIHIDEGDVSGNIVWSLSTNGGAQSQIGSGAVLNHRFLPGNHVLTARATQGGTGETSRSFTVAPYADLALTVTDSPDPVLSGKMITYTVTITNNGPSVATNVVASGTLSSCGNASIAVGATVSCTATAVAGSAGALAQNMIVSAAEFDPITANNSATVSTTVVASGLTGTYFDNSNFTSQKLIRTDGTVNFNWGSGSPHTSIGANTFSVRWTGYVQAAAAGTYTFYTTSDDGIRLWVNGTQLVNDWSNHSARERSGSITLTAGQKVSIQIDYYENTSNAVAQLRWVGPGISKQIIPVTSLWSQ